MAMACGFTTLCPGRAREEEGPDVATSSGSTLKRNKRNKEKSRASGWAFHEQNENGQAVGWASVGVGGKAKAAASWASAEERVRKGESEPERERARAGLAQVEIEATKEWLSAGSHVRKEK